MTGKTDGVIVKLTMAFSPCPNDTFMFHDVAAGMLSRDGYEVEVHLHDIETLNQMARRGNYDLTKLSFPAWLRVQADYQLLNTGAALGFGCGPLLVAARPLRREDLPQCRVAVPGELTTAHLLLQLWAPAARNKIFVRYDRIIAMLQNGEADCGVLIHESRFVPEAAGLVRIADLGEWWETETGQPIPLGCLAAHRRLGAAAITTLENLIRAGIIRSRANPVATAEYVRRHARESDPAVIERHLKMFVTDFSVDLGATGRAAIATLTERAKLAGAFA